MAITDYYSANAYRSEEDSSKVNRQRLYKKGWFDESSSLKRSWGNATDAIPTMLFRHKTPEDLRNPHEESDLDREIENESQENHECIRHAPYPFRIRAALISETAGKGAFYALTPLAIIVVFLMKWIAGESWKEVLSGSVSFFALFSGVPLLMWMLPIIVFTLFPSWVGKKGRGPEWELNRRTGMVRLWDYPRRFSSRRKPEIREHPFTDYEAWVRAAADQYGPWYHFELIHRVSGEFVNVATIIGPQRSPEECNALWHFLQNYMDVTRPLPDVPFLEPHRHNDPVTAEYDRKLGRPAHYWRDMDMDTFEKKAQEMTDRVRSINTG